MKQLLLAMHDPGDRDARSPEVAASADARFAELCRAPHAGWPAADGSTFGSSSDRQGDAVTAWAFVEERELPLVM